MGLLNNRFVNSVIRNGADGIKCIILPTVALRNGSDHFQWTENLLVLIIHWLWKLQQSNQEFSNLRTFVLRFQYQQLQHKFNCELCF